MYYVEFLDTFGEDKEEICCDIWSAEDFITMPKFGAVVVHSEYFPHGISLIQ